MSGFPGTATYASVTDEIASMLQGFTISPDQMTVLTQAVSATDIVFAVEDPTLVSRGVAEVGEELVYIKSTDENANTFTTNAAWRGFRGTLAEAHPVGTTVRFAPSYPRSVIKRQVNNILATLYPDIFAVKALTLTPSSTSPIYELPANAAHVVDVRYSVNTFDGWHRVPAWAVDHSAPVGTSGVMLNLYDIVAPFASLQVLYAVPPAPLVNDNDGFAAVTGLPESAKDIVVYGSLHQLGQAMDLARIPTQTVEADELSQAKPLGSALQVASAFGKQYQAAIERERRALNIKYPARLHKVR